MILTKEIILGKVIKPINLFSVKNTEERTTTKSKYKYRVEEVKCLENSWLIISPFSLSINNQR